MNEVIVTRHGAAEMFIRRDRRFAFCRCMAEAKEADVRGATVAGNLPLHLAALAEEVWAVEFTGTPPRGAEYTLADMESAGARLVPYRVRAIRPMATPPAETAVTISWDDRLQPRGRFPRLFLLPPDGEWLQFTGQPIPGLVSVASSDYTKNGKWSGTVWQLRVHPEAAVVSLMCPWGGWGQTWADIAQGVEYLAGGEGRDRVADIQAILLAYPPEEGRGLANALAAAEENAAAL